MDIKNKLIEIDEDIEIYLRYSDICLRKKDWHGVQDAMSDIRELEAQKDILLQVQTASTGTN